MNICLFHENEIGKALPMSDERAKHITNILHKTTDGEFSAGIINGAEGTARITSISETELSFSFSPNEKQKKLFPISLLLGFPRPIQLKRILRDASSLGVSEILLSGTELGEKSYLRSSLANKNAIFEYLLSGAAQAASTLLPRCLTYENIENAIAAISKNIAVGTKIVLDVKSDAIPLSRFLKNENTCGKKIVLAIGNERGWTNNERALFQKHGYAACSLGKRILRTETASLSAIAIALSHFGEM